MKLTKVLGALLALGCIIACSSSSSTDADDVSGACSALASACHGQSTELGKECHDLGHAGDDVACAPRKAECLAACPDDPKPDSGDGADAGIGADASPADGSTEAACLAYCECMDRTCASAPNYPFGKAGSCLTACASFTAEERACFTGFCTGGADGGPSQHVCDHATGKLGLSECP